MKRYVVDASAAAKWFLPEEHSESAKRLLRKNVELCSPDLLFAEMGNILWKRLRKGEFNASEGSEILYDFKRMPIQIVPCEKLAEIAWGIASVLDRSFYDSLYIALSQVEECPLVTGDRRLFNALSGDPGIELIWVGDLA